MSTARKTISLTQPIYEQALKNAERRGFRHSFSAYLAWLITRDTDGDVTQPRKPRRRRQPHADPVGPLTPQTHIHAEANH